MERNKKPLSTGKYVGAIALVIVLLLALYVGGYFALSKRGNIMGSPNRRFSYDWLAYSYRPVAWFEYTMTGEPKAVLGSTKIYYPDGDVRPLGPYQFLP